jgi:hypothetical protein
MKRVGKMQVYYMSQQITGTVSINFACTVVFYLKRLSISESIFENWWNDIDREDPKYSEINFAQYQFVNEKFHMDRPGVVLGHSRWE